jgi:hypothetical protein
MTGEDVDRHAFSRLRDTHTYILYYIGSVASCKESTEGVQYRLQSETDTAYLRRGRVFEGIPLPGTAIMIVFREHRSANI